MGELTVGAINAERRHQVVDKGYTKEKDDDVFPHNWIDYIQKYLNHADQSSEAEFRANLVKVAALAVAAIEAYDRAVH